MKKTIKALLLSAGLGTRLRPLTNHTPKCLIKVKGVPLLETWLNKLEKLGCEEVLINTHYLKDQVKEFLVSRKKTNMKINIVYEDKLLGTAGTLIKNLNFFDNSIGLLIHADNYMEDELFPFIESFYLRPNNCLLSMLTFETDNPSSCGIIERDENNVLTAFYEKQPGNYGNCANGAIYAFEREFIDFVKNLPLLTTDFSCDVIPKLIGKIHTWKTLKSYEDIGSYASLNKSLMLSENKNTNLVDSFPGFVNSYLNNLNKCFNESINDQIHFLAINLREAWARGSQIFICGNGGSAGNAIHIANDFIYGAGACGTDTFLPGLRVEALTSNPAVMSCLANDTGFENIFSHQIKVKGSKNDILIVLSGSGNSENVIEALKTARERGMTSHAIIAFDGGLCKSLADNPIHFSTYDMQIAEDLQLIVGHLCMQWLSQNKPNLSFN